MNHFKAVCRSTQRHIPGQRSPQENKEDHEVQQEVEPNMREHEDKGRKHDLVNIRYLKFYSVQSVISNKQEFGTSQKELK